MPWVHPGVYSEQASSADEYGEPERLWDRFTTKVDCETATFPEQPRKIGRHDGKGGKRHGSDHEAANRYPGVAEQGVEKRQACERLSEAATEPRVSPVEQVTTSALASGSTGRPS